jgi:hypothetical protein
LYCATRAPGRLAWIGTAAALAFAVNLKIHAGLYFLPQLALLAHRQGWRRSLSAVALALGLALATFLFHPAISLTNYLRWLVAATGHGLEIATIPGLMARALFFSLPLALLLLAGGRLSSRAREHRTLLGLYALAVVVVVFPAAKPGAGLVHLLPLAPMAATLAGMAVADLATRGETRRLLTPTLAGGIGILAGVALMGGWTTEYRAVMLARHITAEAPALRRDLEEILATYPDRTVAMGYGGEGISFQRTYLRPLLIFAGQPLLLDAISMMDAECADLELSPATLDALDAGRVEVWLVPRGQSPFEKKNWYPPHDEVFPAEFRERFRRHYRLDRTTRFFDCWLWVVPG